MATIDTGSQGSKREVNRELALIPFIDFLLCLVTFLLITAVWSQMARMDLDARAPGVQNHGDSLHKRLHVRISDTRFHLEWRNGSTLVSASDVPKRPVPRMDDITYPDLAAQLRQEWEKYGAHRDPSDLRLDQAVLHAPNRTPFSELVAVLDAVREPKRPQRVRSIPESLPVFNVSFAVD